MQGQYEFGRAWLAAFEKHGYDNSNAALAFTPGAVKGAYYVSVYQDWRAQRVTRVSAAAYIESRWDEIEQTYKAATDNELDGAHLALETQAGLKQGREQIMLGWAAMIGAYERAFTRLSGEPGDEPTFEITRQLVRRFLADMDRTVDEGLARFGKRD